MLIVPAEEARRVIAASMLGEPARGSSALTLYAHQEEGAARIERLLYAHGGALLADDVGLGKTFVALAVAASFRTVLIVAPAALREMWLAAARSADRTIRFVSVESLSRGAPPPPNADLVVVDEAHHLRTRQTRRFAAAVALCRNASVLLMSATPIHNRLSDLRALLSLFLGARADALTDDELSRYVVRRRESDLTQTSLPPLPSVNAPVWLDAVSDIDCLDDILELPAPLPPRDGSDGGVLLIYSLVRQWASSRAALIAALRRRLSRATAMHDALCSGRMPTRSELAAWAYADGAQQLAFPELTVSLDQAVGADVMAQVDCHVAAIRQLLARLSASADPDTARAARLLDVLAKHRRERVVAFSEYAETVAALYWRTREKCRAAMLTHSGGRVAGGPVSRRDLLAQFNPSARTSTAEQVDLLLATDVLSEGVDLHAASVLVHLDLCWSPARMEQRLGRLRRIGAARDAVSVYVMTPPAPAERLLDLDRRLRAKLAISRSTLGTSVAGVIEPDARVELDGSSTEREERLAALLRAWRQRRPGPAASVPVAASVHSPIDGAIVCVMTGRSASLLVFDGCRLSDARDELERALHHACGPTTVTSAAEVRAMELQVRELLRRMVESKVVGLSSMRVARTRRSLLQRVDAISRRAPRHSQPRLAPLMRAARAAATAGLSAGSERVLDELSCAPMGDLAWLQAVGEFAALHARSSADAKPEIIALLILKRPS